MSFNHTIPLFFQLENLQRNGTVYRYRNPQSISYKKLQFYSYGLLKERISKMILNEFVSISPKSMSLLRESIISTKHEIAAEIGVQESLFEVLLTECLLLNGNASVFGENTLEIMFRRGLLKYVKLLENNNYWQTYSTTQCNRIVCSEE